MQVDLMDSLKQSQLSFKLSLFSFKRIITLFKDRKNCRIEPYYERDIG